MNRKLLILESNWGENEEEYLTDSRSTSKIYSSIETLLSLHNSPLQIIQRPLLSFRFVEDIKQFTNLPENKNGVNIIILSAHGSLVRKKKNSLKTKKITRTLCAIDNVINISTEMRKVSKFLKRTIIILDSCAIGEKTESFLKASKALGVIGFSKDVDWIDSAVFILALLCKYQDEGAFSLKRFTPVKPKQIIAQMEVGHYKLFFDELGIEYCFVK
ncbi:MAG: hypothetical protein APF84_03965 [Gracilibacter sp. BRH_c7a]|nr:MAG: hypothetical protein APF84_03965 [Gracilibacter sp. BRH_c7a]